MRVVTIHVQPGKTDDAVSVKFWETELDMATSENNGYLQEQIAKLKSVLDGISAVEGFEVCFQIETNVWGVSRCARVHRRQQIAPDQMDAVIQAFSKQGERVAATVKGYGGSFSAIHRSLDKSFSIALCETEENMLAHTPAGDADAITNEPPVREGYEVRLRG